VLAASIIALMMEAAKQLLTCEGVISLEIAWADTIIMYANVIDLYYK
jgi:hypothetical protein